MSFFCLNGDFLLQPQDTIAASTGHYDIEQSVFETIRVVRGNIPLLSYHLQRVKNSMEYFNSSFTQNKIEKIFADLLMLCEKNNQSEKAKVRLSLFYNLGNSPADYLIESFSTPTLDFEIFNSGFNVDIFYTHPDSENTAKPTHHFKSKSIKINTITALRAKEAGLDDYIICKPDGEVIESSIANVFAIKNDAIYTTNKGVEGVMKTFLIDKLKQEGIEVVSKNIYIDFVLQSDELFLTNALRGIIPILKFQEKTFTSYFSKAAFQKYIAPIYL